MSKVVGFEQEGDEKLGEVSVVAQGGNWTLVKSPRKVKEDRKRVRDYDEYFPVLVNTRSTKDRVEKFGEVSESELAQDQDTEDVGHKKVCVSYQNEENEKIIDIVHGKSMFSGLDSIVDMEVGGNSKPAQDKDTEEIGYKKVCISYQNEGNEKIIDIVHGKSMVSGLESVVLTVKRITCVVSGCFSTFSRNDVMLRHLREKHKMQRDVLYLGKKVRMGGM